MIIFCELKISHLCPNILNDTRIYFLISEFAKWFGLKALTTMTLQWVLLLVLVTTLISAEKGSYDETGNDLLRRLDNSGRGLGYVGTWKSPPPEEDEYQDYSDITFKNGK